MSRQRIDLTITLDPDDGAFDGYDQDELLEKIRGALLRGWPLLRSSELDVTHCETCEQDRG